MSAKGISDDLVQRVTEDLRARYGLDQEGLRALGSRLAQAAGERRAENLALPSGSPKSTTGTFTRLAE